MRRYINLFGIWVLLALAHHSAQGAFIMDGMSEGAEYEFARVEAALFKKSAPKKPVEDPHDTAMEIIFDFPLFTAIKFVGADDGKQGFERAPGDRIANSMLAGLIWFLFGYIFVTSLASEDSKLYRFFTGQIDDSTEIPDVVKQAPVASMIGSLKSLERKRFGPALIVAFVHVMLTAVGNSFQIAANFGGSPHGTTFANIMRFPLTPLLVDYEFWGPGGSNDQIRSIVSISNSVTVGILVLMLFQVYWLVAKR